MKYIKPKSSAGYCSLKGWALSVKQIKIKGCISTRKQRGGKPHCSWFVKNEEHPWWAEKRKAREARKKGAG